MSGRRRVGNNIRGPNSALTDFLAANNISANQIERDYAARVEAARLLVEQEEVANRHSDTDLKQSEHEETPEQIKKRKRKEQATVSKIKQSKEFKKTKARLAGDPGEEDDEGIAWDMYAKSKSLPGQLENCDICAKRFTVTAYSKTGPDGGLLCGKCSKDLEAEKKKDVKPKKPAVSREKRRQTQSDLLHGIVRDGSKSLLELCVEKVAANINDVEEFGDLPPRLLNRLSQILSKNRVITPVTLHLFLRPDLDSINLYDCGKLGTEDYISIFQVVPRVQHLNLRNCGQFKDEVFDFILERNIPLRSLQLDAANLVSDAKWREFSSKSPQLESLKLSWLDYSMDDETVEHLVSGCPNLKRLRLKRCFRIGNQSLQAISHLKHLEHLSLRFISPTTSESLAALIRAVGPGLQTLSLEKFENADDTVLEAIRKSCVRLSKFRFTENDYCTDAAFTALFTGWANPPLAFVDLSSTRDVDYAHPDGPDEPIGLASQGFKALMSHSASRIERLDISSCRHIGRESVSEVFDGIRQYPQLRDINLSFLKCVDTPLIAGLFRSCPNIKKATVFGCFNLKDIQVPPGVALIGLPHALEEIVVEGQYIEMDLG